MQFLGDFEERKNQPWCFLQCLKKLNHRTLVVTMHICDVFQTIEQKAENFTHIFQMWNTGLTFKTNSVLEDVHCTLYNFVIHKNWW